MEDQRPYSLQRANGQETNYSAEYTGYGVARYPNGDRYEGDFVDGIRSGKGKYFYSNQDYYEGEFQNNQKHGLGKLQYPIKEDEQTGKKSGGGSYIGYFANGFKEGEGLFTYANKDYYQGFWKQGKKHGKGTYIVFDKKVKLIGEWNEGQLLDGKWIFPNGTVFKGKFKNNQPIGDGQWEFINGNLVKGNYNQIILPSDDPKNEAKLNIRLDWKSKSNIESLLPAKPLIEFSKPIFIFVLGGPGAGKGTQCAKIIEDYKFHHLSTGDLLRAAKTTHPEIAQVMAEGKLVSSEMLIQLIQEAVNQRNNQGVFLLDGFPRNKENLTVWNKVIKEFVDVKFLLMFECTLQTLEKRLLGRAQTSGRDDDNPEAIKKRFVTFEQQTQPIVKAYKGVIEKINADKTVDEIYEDVKAVFRKHRLIR